MIIYNVTTKAAWPISEAWLQWMLDFHIPGVLGTGCFVSHQVAKLLEVDEADGPTYTVQYQATSLEKYQTYINDYSADFRKEVIEKWGDQTVSFRSLMQVVN